MTKKVYLIGPESKVYHSTKDCPALKNPYRYWPLEQGRLLDDGSIEGGSFGRHTYKGRRPCKKCHPRRVK